MGFFAKYITLMILVVASQSCSCTKNNSSEQNNDSNSQSNPDNSQIEISIDTVLSQLSVNIAVSFDSSTNAPITTASTVDFTVTGLEQVSAIAFYSDDSCQNQTNQFDTPNAELSGDITLAANGSYNFHYTATLTDGQTIPCRSAGLELFKVTMSDLSLVYETLSSDQAMWNFWVRKDDPTTQCPGGSVDCIHAGLKRKVTITGYDQCANLSAIDSLNAFHWVCQEASGAIEFVIEDFLPQKGLSDLILTTGFRPISLTVSGGIGAITSNASSSLWDDAISAGPAIANPTNLTASNTIYYYNSDDNLAGYFEFTNPSISLVLLDDATMTHTTDTQYMVYSAGPSFLWIEGDFVGIGVTGSTEATLIRTLTASHVRVHNSKISNANADGFTSSGGYQISVTDTSVYDCVAEGLFANNTSNQILFRDIRVYSNGTYGINSNAVFSRIENIYAANNGNAGLRTETSSQVAIVNNVYAYNNGSHGVQFLTPRLIGNTIFANGNDTNGAHVSDERMLLRHLTTSLNGGSGLNLLTSADGSLIKSLITVKNANDGVTAVADNTTRVKDLVVTNNVTSGLSFAAGSDTQFKGRVLVDDNGTECSSGGGTSNLDDVTCANSGSDPEVFLSTDIDATNLFEGALVDGDSAHPETALIDAGNGVAAFNSLTSYTDFSQQFYGISFTTNNDVLNASNLGRCSAGQNCGFWNYALKDGDTGDASGGNVAIARNRYSCPTGNSTETHSFDSATNSSLSFFDSATEVSGDLIGNDNGVCEDNEDCSFTFLEGAIEISRDLIGNDNGLCESNEACIYAPHIGAYQGEGNLVPSSCSDIGSSGTVVNVTLFEYETQ